MATMFVHPSCNLPTKRLHNMDPMDEDCPSSHLNKRTAIWGHCAPQNNPPSMDRQRQFPDVMDDLDGLGVFNRKRSWDSEADDILPQRLQEIVLDDADEPMTKRIRTDDVVFDGGGIHSIATPEMHSEPNECKVMDLETGEPLEPVNVLDAKSGALILRPGSVRYHISDKIAKALHIVNDAKKIDADDVYGKKNGWQMVLYRPSGSVPVPGTLQEIEEEDDNDEAEDVLAKLADMDLD